MNEMKLIDAFCTGLVRANMDYTMRQTAIMLTLYNAPEINSVKLLATHLDINRPGITRSVDGLQQDGLMDRRADPSDRRGVILVLTPEGRAVLTRMANLAALVSPDVKAAA